MSTSRAETSDVPTVGSARAGILSRLDGVPFLSGASRHPLQVVPLTGGMTNRSFRVTADGRDYAARLSDPGAGLLGIDRLAEYRNSVSAAASGAAPAVAGHAPSDGVLVVEWVHGRTLTERDVQDPATLRRIVAAVRVLHAGPRFSADFDMFEIRRRYLGVVRAHGFRLPPGYLGLEPVVDRLQAALAARPLPTVPCHNDLVPANLVDDGERVWLIDYEYSGNNDPCFELGNLWSESHLPVDALGDLVHAYFGRRSRRLEARCRLYGLVSKLGWTLWASIQDGVSPLDVDFRAWGAERYDRAREELAGEDLERLVEEVRLDD